jgi:LuxR family transcriptional regulator, maltose regulon positive regulatory protein
MASLTARVRPPKPRRNWVERPRLLSALYDALDGRLTLLVGGPGFGKTGLLAQFAANAEREFSIAWLTLEESERDLESFCAALLAALTRAEPAFGEALRNSLEEGGAGELSSAALVDLLVRDIEAVRSRPICLILDDFQRVENAPEVVAFFDALVTQLPDDLHILLSCRTLPPIQFGTLIATQQIKAIGQADLKLDADETRRLLTAALPADSAAAEIDQLAQRSEGWLVGAVLLTQLAALRSAQIDVEPDVERGALHSYIFEAVFAGLPAPLQQFLMRVSALDEIDREYCVESLGWADTPEQLVQIERLNLPAHRIARDEGLSEVVRFHALFLDFLRSTADSRAPEMYRGAHAAIAEALTAADDPERAVPHWVKAGQVDKAMAVFRTIGARIIALNRPLAALALIESFGAARTTDHWVLQIQMHAFMALGQDRQFEQAIDQLEALYLADNDQLRLMHMRMRRSIVRYRQGRTAEALALAQSAAETEAPLALQIRILAYRQAALALVDLGRLSEAIRWAKAGEALITPEWLATAADAEMVTGSLHHIEATALQLKGEALSAHSVASNLLEATSSDASIAHIVETLVQAIHASVEIGSLDTLQPDVDEAVRLGAMLGNRLHYLDALSAQAAVASARGHWLQARALRDEERVLARELIASTGCAPINVGLVDVLCDLARLDIRLLEADAAKQQTSVSIDVALGGAAQLVREAVSIADGSERPREVLVACTRQGALHMLRGDLAQAEAAFARAMTAAGEFADRMVLRLHLWRLAHATALKQTARVAELRQLLAGFATRLGAGFAVVVDEEGPTVAAALKGVVLTTGAVQRPQRAAASRKPLPRTAQPAPLVPTAKTRLRVHGFGLGEVWVDDSAIPHLKWGWNIPRELLYFMLVHKKATRDQIGDAFWPESNTEAMQRSFHVSKANIRATLGHVAVVYDDGRYWLNPELDITFDGDQFERLCIVNPAVGDSAVRTRALDSLLAADALYQDEFLTKSSSSWVERVRQRYRTQYLQAAVSAEAIAVALHTPDRALPMLLRASAFDPLREDIARALMRTHAHGGRRSDAVSVYQQLAQHLKQELNIAPERATRTLLEEISTA